MPAIITLFESEEGKRNLEEWKAAKDAENESKLYIMPIIFHF